MKFRNEITLKVNSIIRKYIFSAQEVNVDQYLDYLETIFSDFNWKDSSWVNRLQKVWSIGDITLEFYKDILDETVADREKALIELGMAAWNFVKVKFKITLPFGISMFEKKIIETIITSSVRYAISKLNKSNGAT